MPKFKEPKFYADKISTQRSIMGHRGSLVVHSDNKMNLSRNPRVPLHVHFTSDFIDINDSKQVKEV